MAESVLEAPDTGGLMNDVAGVGDFLIDPKGAARRLPRKLFWIIPVILVSIVAIITGIYNLPLIQQAMANQPPPANVSPEQFQKQMQVGLTIQHYAMYAAPLFIIIFSAISALIVMATCMVIDLKPRFIEMFNLMTGLSIIEALKYIAITAILHARGEPSGMADLKPALGLDIFMPAGSSKMLTAFLGYFNIFQIWQIVMAVLIFAAAYRVSKTKAAIAVAPLYAIGLLLTLVGAIFSPGK